MVEIAEGTKLSIKAVKHTSMRRYAGEVLRLNKEDRLTANVSSFDIRSDGITIRSTHIFVYRVPRQNMLPIENLRELSLGNQTITEKITVQYFEERSAMWDAARRFDGMAKKLKTKKRS